MKRLLLTAAVVISALSLNAAAFTWGFTGGDYTSPDGDADFEGGTVFLYLGTVTAGASSFDFGSGADAATLVTYARFDDNQWAYGNYDADAPTESDAVGSTAAGQDFTLILVADDAVTSLDNYEGKYYLETGTSTETAIPGAVVTYIGTFESATTIAQDSWQTMTAAPEPTSGLLLLLGMAGLALKRKKA